MSRSSLLIFSIAVSVLLSGAMSGAFAETTAKSTNFEKTTIIEFVNNGDAPIKTVRMWLGQDGGAFTSFKTERNWTGAKTPQGLLVFSTDTPVASGESVKFGLKTEVAGPGINWKTIDAGGNDISIGKAIAGQPAQAVTPPVITPPVSTPEATKSTSFDSATFRIIPEKPKNGDSIRIVGDGFPPKQQVNFYIDNEMIDDFMTDEGGHLVGKVKIPITKSDRVEFSISDSDGHKKTISIRLEQAAAQAVSPHEKHIQVTDFPEIVHPGDTVKVSGTGKPSSTLTITTRDPAGNKISELTISVDNQGNWSHTVVIPPDIGIGSRQVDISDGTEVITKTVSIASLSTLHLTPSHSQYAPSDTMTFNGTTTGTSPIEIVIKDPIGKEVFYDTMQPDGSGAIQFDFLTDASSIKGTYVVLATQGESTTIVRVGLGEPPGESIVASFDKLNYATSDKAKMTVRGPANVNVSVLILDPSDKPKGPSDYIKLGQDGQAEYEIDLSQYKSGVYSAVLKYQKYQIDETFTVGLQLGAAGEIKMQATKQTYQQGNSILVLGSAKPNSLLTLKFADPSGNTIRHKEVFTDKLGKFADSTFRIPVDGAQGSWSVRAESGSNYAEVKIQVASDVEKPFSIVTDKTAYKQKDTVSISGSGGGKSQTVEVTVTDANGVKITTLNTFTTSDGVFKLDWPTAADIPLGTYKISAKNGILSAETSVTIQ